MALVVDGLCYLLAMNMLDILTFKYFIKVEK